MRARLNQLRLRVRHVVLRRRLDRDVADEITAYSTTRRTSEIGIRMAFGATRASVLWMVLRQVVVMTGVGLAVGVPLSIAASRVVRSMLFGLEPGDPMTLVSAALVLAVVAVFAGWVPARRASRMDPLAALRYE